MSGSVEELSFLSFLIRAHNGEAVESLRDKVYLPQLHQDLRDRWYPEVLHDQELQQRILNACTPTVSQGPFTFAMVPLVEMRLDRTKIMTRKSTNKVSMFSSNSEFNFG